jgi:hypothetical protein
MDFILTQYDNMLRTKDGREMQLILDIFKSGRNKNNKKMKEEFLHHLMANPVVFSEAETKQKEIYESLLQVLK